MFIGIAEFVEVLVGVAKDYSVLADLVPTDICVILVFDTFKDGVSMTDIKVIVAAVLVEFAEALIVLSQEDFLAAQLAQLHALLNESALTVELGLVVLHTVLNWSVLVFCVDWHLS